MPPFSNRYARRSGKRRCERQGEPPASPAAGPVRRRATAAPARRARRNHERLVTAAREVFAEQGVDASMEAIARKAGVGVGTLYRHFPNGSTSSRPCTAPTSRSCPRQPGRLSPRSSRGRPSSPSSRRSCATPGPSRPFSSELQQAFEKNPGLRSHSRDLIDAAFDLVIDRAKAAGVIRGDVDGRDVTQLVSPVCTNPSNSVEKSERLVSMILDGLRYPAEMSGRR